MNQRKKYSSVLYFEIPNFQIEEIKNKENVLFIGEIPIKDTE